MRSSPHLINQHKPSVSAIMRGVLFAALPATLFLTAVWGIGIITNLLICAIVAIITEAVILRVRGKPLAPYLSDGSVLVTATLLALALPPGVPLWVLTIGTVFAVAVAKHCYGGLGQNIFNPAMAGYILLLIATPIHVTIWPSPNVGWLPAWVPHVTDNIDAITSATPLATIGALTKAGERIADKTFLDGVWMITNLLWAAGGIWLLWRRYADWRLPLWFLCTLAVLATIGHWLSPDSMASAPVHLLSGATMMGAFFILTDPVTAAASPRGRIAFAVLAGILTYVIRALGAQYPDSIAFAVLLTNCTAPLINTISQKRWP